MKYLIALVLSLTATTTFAQQTKTFVASRDFCEVVIRAGNVNDAGQNPVVFQGKMASGQRFNYAATFLFAQREGNPGVCGSGRAYWNSCSWNECTLN
jgi:hypothetical protein